MRLTAAILLLCFVVDSTEAFRLDQLLFGFRRLAAASDDRGGRKKNFPSPPPRAPRPPPHPRRTPPAATCVDTLPATATGLRSLLDRKTCKDYKRYCRKKILSNGSWGWIGQKWCRKTCGACGGQCMDRLPANTTIIKGRKVVFSCKDLSCDGAYKYRGFLGSVGNYWCQQTCGTCPDASGTTQNIGSMYTPALKEGFCLDNCTSIGSGTCGMASCLMPDKPTWAQVEVSGFNRTYQLKNILTGQCLGYPKAGNLRHVYPTIQYFYATMVDCAGDDYSIWVSPLLKQYGTFNLRYGTFSLNQALPDMCLDVKQYNKDIGAPVIIYPCKTGTNLTLTNQLWNFTV